MSLITIGQPGGSFWVLIANRIEGVGGLFDNVLLPLDYRLCRPQRPIGPLPKVTCAADCSDRVGFTLAAVPVA
jgi:hypothetical protein